MRKWWKSGRTIWKDPRALFVVGVLAFAAVADGVTGVMSGEHLVIERMEELGLEPHHRFDPEMKYHPAIWTLIEGVYEYEPIQEMGLEECREALISEEFRAVIEKDHPLPGGWNYKCLPVGF